MVLGEAFYGFRWNLLGASFYSIVIMTLKRYSFPLNSIRSYFNGGLSFVMFLIVEGNVNIFSAVFCGITKRYALIIWAGLRHFVPKHHVKNSHCLRSEISLILTIDSKKFDILEKKC